MSEDLVLKTPWGDLHPRELRRRLKISQKMVGEKLGCSQSAISKLENRPLLQWGIFTLISYTKALGASLKVTAVGIPEHGDVVIYE